MRITGGTPNLINGVSRQPPDVRLTSQLEESVNQFPTVSRGLVPRNPAILKGIIYGALPSESLVHLIDRDPQEQYVVTISKSGIQVHDLEGNPKVVNTPNGVGYLVGANHEDLQALTVQDHTFILNKSRTVQKLHVRSPELDHDALIHIARGDYFTRYLVRIDGDVAGDLTTDGGPYSDQEDARKAERGARPGVVAEMLAHGTASTNSTIPAAAAKNLTDELGPGPWDVVLHDNVIHVTRTDGDDFSIEAEAGDDGRIRAHKGSTPDYADLPKKAPDGFTIRVSGSEETGYDDYWLRFTKTPTDAEGAWKETIAPDTQYRIDPSTMPHLLVREADGSFTFKQAEWADREVGDEDTNPWPSFVGQKIRGMAFGNNRVGFHSGESISMSRSGEFFNFWVESILTPLDTDPVDVSVSYPEVSTINHVVPFSGEMILFTSSVPFRLAGGQDTLTQKNVNVKHLLSNTVSEKARPVAAGSHLYFVNDTPSGCFVHEFSYDNAVDNLVAQCITDHVAGYVPSGVTMIEADGDLKLLMLVSENEPNVIYVYKWLWIGNDKAQSAWQKWTLQHPIRALRFYGEELVVVTERPSSREVLSINCHEAWVQGGPCPIYLDRQVVRTGVYDPITQTTSFELPYGADGASAVSVHEDTFGRVPDISPLTSGNTLVVLGEATGPHRIGFGYKSWAVISPLVHRTTNNQGGYGNGKPGVLVTTSNIRFSTGATAYMRVEIDRDYRKPVVYDFSAALTGTKTGRLGELVIGEIDKNVSVMSRVGDYRITVGNLGPFPYSLLAYEWTGDGRQVSY